MPVPSRDSGLVQYSYCDTPHPRHPFRLSALEIDRFGYPAEVSVRHHHDIVASALQLDAQPDEGMDVAVTADRKEQDLHLEKPDKVVRLASVNRSCSHVVV